MWMGQTSMYMKKQMILVTLLLFLFFRENAKALRFDALIDTEMVNREMGTREKNQEMENHRII
jgi:hypothetical protein